MPGPPDKDNATGKGKKKTSRKLRESLISLPIDLNGPIPGDAALPAGAEDGFDSTVYLSSKTGEIEYKTDDQLHVTKLEATGLSDDGVLKIWTDGSSRGNGTQAAMAGIGVYFGPGDKRYVGHRLLHAEWLT